MKDLHDSHKQQLSALAFAKVKISYKTEYDPETGVKTDKSTVSAKISGFAEVLEPIKGVVRAALEGPWTLEEEFTIVEIQTKCCEGHRLKRWNTPVRENRDCLFCDVCRSSI